MMTEEDAFNSKLVEGNTTELAGTSGRQVIHSDTVIMCGRLKHTRLRSLPVRKDQHLVLAVIVEVGDNDLQIGLNDDLESNVVIKVHGVDSTLVLGVPVSLAIKPDLVVHHPNDSGGVEPRLDVRVLSVYHCTRSDQTPGTVSSQLCSSHHLALLAHHEQEETGVLEV